MERLRILPSINKRNYHKIFNKITPANYVVNLRSDTFTTPDDEMREVMKEAIVGDDVWQEDKTVLDLENKFCEITRKEAGLFVASGTMGNLLSVLSHCSRRGSEVLLGDMSHIFHTEQANIVQFGGVQPYTVPTKSDGTYCLQNLEHYLREDNFHYPSTELICIENTHGQLGGKVLPLDWIDQIGTFAQKKGLPLHLDGARIFNASIASGIPVSRYLRGVNTASICLSKGLGAPIGTVIVGDRNFIENARRLRKGIGGGWRQAGIIAAAGIYALDHNVQKLSQDHKNAKIIAKGINEMNSPNVRVDEECVQTNMVLVELNTNVISVQDFCQQLMEVTDEEEKALGRNVSVLACPYTPTALRLVIYFDISEEDAHATVSKFKFVAQALPS